MTILYPSPVKSTRPFGLGILASRPTYRAPMTASEASWWAAESARLEDARFDRMAGESAALDRMERGIACC